jgi:hypothetical protein
MRGSFRDPCIVFGTGTLKNKDGTFLNMYCDKMKEFPYDVMWK